VTEKFGPNVVEAGSLLANKFGEEAKAKRNAAAIALEEAEKAKAENNNETNRALVKQARDNFETASREAKEWETGGNQRLIIDSALNVISTALAGRPAAEVVASGLSPAVNNQIKKATTDAKGNVNTALNLTAHALWGAVEAYAGNRNVAAGAAGAAGGEAAAHFLASILYDKSPEKLSEEEKRTVSSLSQVAAGIAGGSGSGKSTITNLIPRLFSIESGDILFKGKSIYEWNVDDLRSRIGYVPQKAYLFTGTVEMNIRYGAAPNQDVSVQDIENACRLSKADEFISRLEGGYQYIISQGGTNLSGGQRQRLAMARALVRKPDLFIFDDSFSALDGTTERAVRTVLHEELQKDNRPALISVEQKVSAAKKADHILIINRGQVAGYGTHDELAENSTVYKQILASQELTA